MYFVTVTTKWSGESDDDRNEEESNKDQKCNSHGSLLWTHSYPVLLVQNPLVHVACFTCEKNSHI